MYKVETTTDTSIFKTIETNRPLNYLSVQKLVLKIRSKGFLISPIVVTEKLEVIDGQHRLAAVNEINKDVENKINVPYVVNSLCSLEDIEDANNTQTPWTLQNYLNARATRGDFNCIRVLELIEQYNDFAPGVVANIMNSAPSKTAINSIKKGSYNINENLGRQVLDACREVKDCFSTDIGTEYALPRFANSMKKIIVNNPNFDIDTLAYKAENKPIKIFSNQTDIIERMVNVYNWHIKDDSQRISM